MQWQFSQPQLADLKVRYFYAKNLKSDDGTTAIIYTELQTAHKSQSETANQHSKTFAGKSRTFLKNGQDTREANQSGTIFNNNAYQMHKKVPRVWAK
jgi:hypothetical protein